jgi:predicted type IV restriction endonuclease
MIYRNDTSNLNSTLRFPDLTEARDLDTLEYSNNKDDLSISKLEQESKKLFESNRSKEQALDKYLVYANDFQDEAPAHTKKDSIITLLNQDIGYSKGEKTTYESSKAHTKKLIKTTGSMESKSKPPTFKKKHHSKKNSKTSFNKIQKPEVLIDQQDDKSERSLNILKQSTETYISFEHNPIATARSK